MSGDVYGRSENLFSPHCLQFRYPIDKTPININLTKTTHPPTLSRQALLMLVERVSQNKKRSECVEFHEVGQNSPGTSLSCDPLTGKSSTETRKTNSKAREQSC